MQESTIKDMSVLLKVKPTIMPSEEHIRRGCVSSTTTQ